MYELSCNINISRLSESFNGQIYFDEAAPNTLRIMAPFYHEDGDMYDIFLVDHNGKLQICDFGTTLMRLSYKSEIDTTNKEKILDKIIIENNINNDGGNLYLSTCYETFFSDLMQFQIAISKISNMDILKREIVKSMFYEYLSDYILKQLEKYQISPNYMPTNDKQLIVDYFIPNSKPLFIFGVNENTKAAKVVISCLTFQKKKLPFRSLVVHENFDELSSFNRNQITNAADKQFTTLDDFKSEGLDYIERELAS